MLRRYYDGATADDLIYEHAVLRHLARLGWVVPDPVSEPVHYQGTWFCLTRFVPGQPIQNESTVQRRRRGRDLARLHLSLRELGPRLGQRPGWRAQHTAVTIHTDIDWDSSLAALAEVDGRLASWAAVAAAQTRAALLALGVDDLPVTVVHGDFGRVNEGWFEEANFVVVTESADRQAGDDGESAVAHFGSIQSRST